jgi:acyl-coenzyme A synthetase/AMP-(fatty) acid ligase
MGSALSRGYWNATGTTRAAFVQNPLVTAYDDRMYRTGDLAYYDGAGLIIFVGRRDSQIKLRGNRIELGEIEVAARSLAGIDNACVLFDAEREEIVLFAGTAADLRIRTLNMALRGIIPAYMLPRRVVCMPSLPQTPNGKIDRVLLAELMREV